MTSFYDKCEQGVRDLLQAIGPESTDYNYALTLQARLAEVLSRVRDYGRTESRAAELAEIMEQLNRLCLAYVGKSFNDFAEIGGRSKAVSELCHNLPQRNRGPLVGRETELKSILALLSPTSGSSVIAIHGLGGVGKTSLALEVAYYHLQSHTALPPEQRFDAIVWTSAKELAYTQDGVKPRVQRERTLNDIWQTIATTLGREDITRAPREDQDRLVRQALSRQRILLIVDNLETLEDEGAISFLSELPYPTQAVVTTRRAVFDWRTVDLEPLTAQDTRRLVDQSPGVRSLLGDKQIDHLHRLTSGIPLALHFCLKWIGHGEDPQALMSLLEKQLFPDSVISFCLDYGWRQLSRGASRACDMLVLAALCDVEVGASKDMLTSVLDRSPEELWADWREVRRWAFATQTAQHRCLLLPLVQEYVLRQLTETRLDEWRRRLVGYCLGFVLERCDTVCLGDDLLGHHNTSHPAGSLPLYWRSYMLRERYDEIWQEYKNFKVARDYTMQQGDWKSLTALFSGLVHFMARRNLWSERLEWVDQAIEAARQLGDIESVVWYQIDAKGWILLQQGKRVEALQELEAADIAATGLRLNDAIVLARCYKSVVWRKSEPDRAREVLESARNIPCHPLLKRHIHTYMGEFWFEQRDLDEARKSFDEALSISEGIGDDTGAGIVRISLAFIDIEQGHFDNARQMLQKALEFEEGLERIHTIAQIHHGLARIEFAVEHYEQAREHTYKALSGYERLGMQAVSEVRELLDRIHYQIGQREENESS